MHADVEKCNGALDYCEDLLAAAAFIDLPSDSKDEDIDSVGTTDLSSMIQRGSGIIEVNHLPRSAAPTPVDLFS